MDRTSKLTRLADSYLDHIRIAVEAGDAGAPFRDFVDNWAAFASEADHHRNTRDRVIWFNNPHAIIRRAMLLSLPFRSVGADEILQYAVAHPDEYRERRKAKDKAVKLIIDHTVPLAVIVGQLFEVSADLSREGIRTHLKRFYCLGLLSDADDAKLNRLGFRSRMPPGWDGQDLTVRYRTARIAAVYLPQDNKDGEHPILPITACQLDRASEPTRQMGEIEARV